MQRNARLDDLCKRLLAPFTPLLEEVERLSNATVVKDRAATMPPLAAKMPRRGDSPPSPSSHTGGETGQPAALGATIQSVRLAPSAASDTPARISAPEPDASIKPATTVLASDRPAICLTPRVSAVRSSRPVTTPPSAATESPPVTAIAPLSPASGDGITDARRAMPGSAGVPADLWESAAVANDRQAMLSSASQPPLSATYPTTAPANRQGIPLIPRPVQQAAARLVDGVVPVLERAYRLTLAAQETPVGRVHNTFNVAVSLNPAETAADVDREALQEALVELLRTAARRQGLDV